MNRANRFVVESNIPSADPKIDLRNGPTAKQRRELEDITAWMELQEECEMEMLIAEMAGRNHRAGRRSLGY